MGGGLRLWVAGLRGGRGCGSCGRRFDPRARSPATVTPGPPDRHSTQHVPTTQIEGYKFQFVTLAGFHSLNHGMFELAAAYGKRGMAAYSELQTAEFASEARGYTATKHQREVGTGYFDAVSTVVTQGASSTLALKGSTEAAQFA